MVDVFAIWRQKVADKYHDGSIDRLMGEAGTGGVKLLLLALMDQEDSRPGLPHGLSVAL